MGNIKFDDSDHGGHLDVLGSIPIEYRNAILRQCEKLSIAEGQILWNQGDAAEYVAFLVEGKVMSTHLSPNGKTGVTGLWFAGDILGALNVKAGGLASVVLGGDGGAVLLRLDSLVPKIRQLMQMVFQRDLGGFHGRLAQLV